MHMSHISSSKCTRLVLCNLIPSTLFPIANTFCPLSAMIKIWHEQLSKQNETVMSSHECHAANSVIGDVLALTLCFSSVSFRDSW